ncbi:MAG: MCE family protein [Deltaproteobacteria bacterium]|uniref:MCE family protein n=1 Tax=Candidatus Desulfacyla euxinica TaxID=2841693 RepID=A0A8J6MZX8_9DELT|nr:MCE family protein [Candidatus Desulfacyla euxinica]MBL7217675.1 MCE family protein [Desulfobacteraceae bacterium]
MESNIPEPEMKSRSGISPIWILPIVALLVAGWIAYKAIIDSGIEATIRFENAQGIEKGKTRVIYRGMPIGLVKDLSINKDFKSTEVSVEFVKQAREQLRKNTRFWMVEPKISLKGITGLETILRGNYITMIPGDGAIERHFVALSKPPAILSAEPGGLNIRLIADELGSLSQGSEVYYKGIKAGEILDFSLNEKGKVIIEVHIDAKFAKRVKKSTRFYNVSGITFEAGLSGFKVSAEALSTLLMGGIAFFKPEEDGKSIQAIDSDSFRLFKNIDLAEQEGKRITLLFDEAKGIYGKTQIRYKGVEIGGVFSVKLNKKMTGIQVTASVQKQYRSLLREGTQFWLVEPSLGLAGAKNLETIVTGTYITLRPGKGKPKRTFIALGAPPTYQEPRKGLKIILIAERLGSLKANDPVYFRQIKVGEVTGYRLSKDATSAIINVDIEKPYAPLVRTTSKFWNASGINIDFSLFKGAKVRTESMQSILEGGIAFATPGKKSAATEETKFDNAKGVVLEETKSKNTETEGKSSIEKQPSGKPVKNGAKFVLHTEVKDEWLKWRPSIVLGK